jgi:predicted nucleic acid-binding protein
MRKRRKAGSKMRVLVDSSTIIALAKIGRLNILENVFGEICITTKIKEELLGTESPETEALKEAINKWIQVIGYGGDAVELRKYGLDLGEASLFLASEADDLLVIDEANARRFAESKGLKFTGLIGLLVAAVKTDKLTDEKAVETLNALAKSDFRISLPLYLWALEKIEHR